MRPFRGIRPFREGGSPSQARRLAGRSLHRSLTSWRQPRPPARLAISRFFIYLSIQPVVKWMELKGWYNACSVHISHRGQSSWSHPWLCPRHMQQNNGGCACRQSAGGRGNMHGLCPNCVVRHLLPRFSCSHRGGSSWSLPWLPPPTCSNITQSNIFSGCTSQQSGEPRGRRRRPGLSQRVPSEPRRDLD